jgi:hypothetical protein
MYGSCSRQEGTYARECVPEADAERFEPLARFRGGGDLLPPSQSRDRRALLELRAADMPRLHDLDARRDALP